MIGLPSIASQSAFGVTEVIKNLKELREKYLRSFGAEKQEIEKAFRATQRKLFEENVLWAVADSLVRHLTDWDPFSYESCGWFDPIWMFGVSEGFDIVIANPPYLESRSPSFSNDSKTAIQQAVRRRWGDDAVLITRGSDLLVYFFDTSIFILREKGCIVFITQNSWLNTEYGKKFQTFLLRHTHVSNIIDSDYKHFDSDGGPNINTVISIFLGKEPNQRDIVTFTRYHKKFDEILDTAKDTIDPELVETAEYQYSESFLVEYKWGMLHDLINPEFRELIDLISKKGLRIEEVPELSLSIGQGLNLTSDYIVNREVSNTIPGISKALIPFFTTEDGAPFNLEKTTNFIIDTSKLMDSTKKTLKSLGIRTFDPSSTSKNYPILILPRGIGRHFCAIKNASAFSSSNIDIYCD